jgi:hypothetical protein
MSGKTSAQYESQKNRWIIVISILALLLFLLIVFIANSNKFINFQSINSFEDCMGATGSTIQFTYPGVCVTYDGQKFIESVSPIPTETLQQPNEYESICTSNGGVWLNEYYECEGIDAQTCKNSGGVFNECGSACRHNPNQNAPCTMMCIPFCTF